MIIEVPARATVWAFTDVHGVRSGLQAALRQAGIIDRSGWCAPPGTVLVGCGDYIDRGADAPGMIALLRRLEAQAAERGGGVFLALGNHEQMLRDGLRGSDDWLFSWLSSGGRATARSFGIDPDADLDTIRRGLLEPSPWLLEWLDGLPDAVRWRDVLFVHAGLPPYKQLEMLGGQWMDHLWIRRGFFDETREADDLRWVDYHDAGIDRVVFGHTPMAGATAFHEGMSLCLDTNACARPFKVTDGIAQLTLARIPKQGPLTDAELVVVETHDAPDRMVPEILTWPARGAGGRL